MRAVIQSDPSNTAPDSLQVGDVPRPTPGPGEVLIRVTAAGVNRADTLQRQGNYPPPKGASDILGLEVSGHIATIGPGVRDWKLGQPCVALLAGGGYAEYVAVPAGQVVPPPEGIDLVSAAGIIEVAATVVSNLELAGLQRRNTILIHGGAGGIGGFAIPYAKHLGVRVISTAGSEEKRQHCRRLGADVVLDHHEDWAAGVRDAAEDGVDVILDIIGAKYLHDHLKLLATGGRIITIGLQGGTKAELNLGLLLAKRASIHATGLRARPVSEKTVIVNRVVETVWPLLVDGTIPLAQERRYPLAAVADAHAHLDSGEASGKLILTL
ncbi:NAD(P)H-quinone oxidoreductase [Parenemella sanctibonifatiensis]|uniref:NAD(P)H-quinone oxidoreductase n=1 Tax=Parenemella sanctibonifatiensis TaxID=2016505 RepID=A0A255E2S0_9ACTN|nr:NAD(P)H-quinone oxidoreductase [Parenemella sanctibonifatiensis]OYN85844.1 NAD(P)H-quinone oxidoreductase [Parenemella sanctibonifatiensis]